MSEKFDVVIIGAGASGLMCAAQAGKRGKRVIVLDNGPKPGRKILMAGGGKCNFTNRSVSAENFICANPHFVKSALSRFTAADFIDMVESRGIPYHERSHGQLFCDESSARILEMLLAECRTSGAVIATSTPVRSARCHEETGIFHIKSENRKLEASSLVIATGGVSIPASGATPFGYKLAEQFGLKVVTPRPGLVPFTLSPSDKALLEPLSGISVAARVSCCKAVFEEQLLFTHRGLSGPVILQVSSYWHPGETIAIDLLPGRNIDDILEKARNTRPKKQVRSLVSELLPKRLTDVVLKDLGCAGSPVGALSGKNLNRIAQAIHRWRIKPGGTEGNRTAEVTVGGVDCRGVSSKTFEANRAKGLYFIGEVLDVTGNLGGYNLQWAWSSGYCAGQWV
jgi:predicted Rossmann fold flavoprotein